MNIKYARPDDLARLRKAVRTFLIKRNIYLLILLLVYDDGNADT